ncbi:hypothetical protein [Lysobacter sp.]|uniref:hypothetical protein n=1 Tax=Lysobacter sp. TaxID=72226 RepID=UPI002D5C5E22|nr:hypothetical protein [Lysobacter sp.]HZX76158.1 hypothetical protein [Lysobacter sp.]
MSKSAEEQATEILVAVLSTEKGLQYIGESGPENLGVGLSTVWTKVYETILDRRIHPKRS